MGKALDIEPEIFIPEAVSSLKVSFEAYLREMSVTNIKIDGHSVQVYKKKSKRCDTGELLSLHLNPVETPSDGAIVSLYRGPSWMNERQFSGLTDTELVDLYHASLAQFPQERYTVHISRDRRSFSAYREYRTITYNRHNPEKGVIYKYTQYPTGYLNVFRQARKGVEGEYLRSYYLKKGGGLSELPCPPRRAVGEHTSALAVFFNCDEKDVYKEYDKRVYVPAQRVFPQLRNLSESEEGRTEIPAGSLFAERDLKVTTLTALVQKYLGVKPRKDFVRKCAQAMNEQPLRVGIASVDISSQLMRVARHVDVGFDLEDYIVKTLEECISDGFSQLSPRWRPMDAPVMLDKLVMVFGFLPPSAVKRVVKNMLESLGVSAMELYDAALGIQEVCGGRNGYAHPRDGVSLQEDYDSVRPTDEAKQEMEVYGYNEISSVIDVHHVVSDYVRALRTLQLQGGGDKRLPASPFMESALNLTPFEFDGSRYTFIVPETNREVLRWGSHLNNCLASYVYDVREGSYALLFVEREGRPYAALGMRAAHDKNTQRSRYREEQFYRVNNYDLAEDEHCALMSHIADSVSKGNVEVKPRRTP